MEKIIVTTSDELEEIIENIIRKLLPIKEDAKKTTDNLSLEEAIVYLKENGFSISKAKIYKLTSMQEMPYGKYNNKLIFKKNELLEWAENQIINISDNNDTLIKMINNRNKKVIK